MNTPLPSELSCSFTSLVKSISWFAYSFILVVIVHNYSINLNPSKICLIGKDYTIFEPKPLI
jgi:hypothetical protein